MVAIRGAFVACRDPGATGGPAEERALLLTRGDSLGGFVTLADIGCNRDTISFPARVERVLLGEFWQIDDSGVEWFFLRRVVPAELCLSGPFLPACGVVAVTTADVKETSITGVVHLDCGDCRQGRRFFVWGQYAPWDGELLPESAPVVLA